MAGSQGWGGGQSWKHPTARSALGKTMTFSFIYFIVDWFLGYLCQTYTNQYFG